MAEEETETITQIPEIRPLEPIEYSFFEKILRRVYLEDTPRLIGSIVSTGTAFPTDPSTGQLFFRTDTKKFFLYDGTDWLQLNLLDSKGHSKIPGRYLKE